MLHCATLCYSYQHNITLTIERHTMTRFCDKKCLTDKLTTRLATQKESEIKNAITHIIGNEQWTIADIAGRGEIKILPDKTEIFAFGGIDLIHFGCMRTEIYNDGIGIKMRAVQEFRLLYS